VITVYRSPSGELDEFFSWLHDILDPLINKGRSIILMGDLNININNKGPDSKQLI
jgi:exonuclease III